MDNRDVCIQLQGCIYVAGIQTVTFIRHRKQEVRWGPEDSGRRRVPSNCFHDLTFYSKQIHIWVKEYSPTQLQLLASITDICFIVSSVSDSSQCSAGLWLGPQVEGWGLLCYPKLAESVMVNRHLLDVSNKMSWPRCFMLVWEHLSQSDPSRPMLPGSKTGPWGPHTLDLVREHEWAPQLLKILIYISILYIFNCSKYIFNGFNRCLFTTIMAGRGGIKVQIYLKSHFHLCFFRQAEQSFSRGGMSFCNVPKISCNSFIVAGCSLWVRVNVGEC